MDSLKTQPSLHSGENETPGPVLSCVTLVSLLNPLFQGVSRPEPNTTTPIAPDIHIQFNSLNSHTAMTISPTIFSHVNIPTHDPLIHNLQNNGWKTNPLITITTGVRGAVHEHLVNKLTNFKIPIPNNKTLMKSIHWNVVKYLTYLILNKRTLDNNTNTRPLTFMNY